MFRTTSSLFTNQALEFSQRFNSNIALYQKQISSGEKLHRPSDDPVGFKQVISINARVETLVAELSNVTDAEAKLNHSVSQLTTANDLLVTARSITLQAIQANSDSERQSFAIEIENILSSLQKIALSHQAGAHLFGGTKTNAPPFRFENPSVTGQTLIADYVGSDLPSESYIGQAISVKTYHVGSEIFEPTGRKPAIVVGTTGAKAGSGTANLVGRATLQVRHLLTTYQSGSGITAGTDSAAKDTVIGPAGRHRIRVIDTAGDGSAGTISLNEGPPVTFTNADSNLEVTGADGLKVYVNTTSITPGFNGDLDITSTGNLSIDGGLSKVPITFSNNQNIGDSSTGRFVPIDSSAISKAGDDYVEFPGTSNAFQTLYELFQDLKGARQISNTDLAASLNRRLGDLESASNKILDAVGQQSAALFSLKQLGTRIEDFQLDSRIQLNGIQSTDVSETILKLRNDQTLLEYTYSVTAQINSVQLINFLR